jgi:hypothetical protein
MTKTAKRPATKPAKKITAKARSAAITIPSLKKGEHYAGIILDASGKPDYHLIGLPGEIEQATWEKAKAWAKKQGGELPNLRELGLERVNARQEFKDDWYWSCEQHAGNESYAWFQFFFNGFQLSSHKGSKLRARAVRRVKI